MGDVLHFKNNSIFIGDIVKITDSSSPHYKELAEVVGREGNYFMLTIKVPVNYIIGFIFGQPKLWVTATKSQIIKET